MKKYLVVAALATAILVAAGCGSHTNRLGDARKAAVQFTTALQKRNFYDACLIYSDASKADLPAQLAQWVGYPKLASQYTPTRACAAALSQVESNGVVFTEFKVSDHPIALSDLPAGYTVPKNGYVFKATYRVYVVDPFFGALGYRDLVIYIGVQRDSSGHWRVVAVS